MHEKIVDEKFNFSAVKMSEETNERNSVEGSQRVIRCKNETTFGRDIFFPYHIDMHVHIRKQIVGEFYTGTVFICFENVVYFVLVYRAFKVAKKKSRNFFAYFGAFSLTTFSMSIFKGSELISFVKSAYKITVFFLFL